MPFAGLSTAAAERLSCTQKTAPSEGPEPCGMTFAERCWEGERTALTTCLVADYQAWRELEDVLAANLPADWRKKLAERGFNETQIFMSEPGAIQDATTSDVFTSPCDSAVADPDILDQCIFEASNMAGSLADLFQKMYEGRR